MVPRRTFWGFIIAFFLLILEVRFQRVVPRFNLSILLQAPKGHYVELNLTMESSYLTPCIDDEYIEVRDGYNKSANLLGVFCGGNISVVMRSSGQNLWIRKSVHYISRFRGSFANKTLNFTVEPNLDKVAGTQFVIFNQTSSLWCPAQGAPAPFIVWRKNERVVQNSTSVKYQLTITEENTDEYSCEVNGQDDVDKKEIRFVSERCPDPCRCTITVGIIGAATRTECRGKHLQSVPRHLPFSTAKLDLDNNQIEELPPEDFHNNSQLVVLALDNNQIKELPPGVFNNNTELTTLNLRDNQINQLPFGVFNNNLKLTYLVLDNNQIKELPPGVFNNNTELIELWLNGNELESLPGDLYSQLVKLQLLALDNNQIKKLPRGLLNNNTELVKLWLNGNELESLPGDLFTQLFKLQLLYLGNNQIKELPPGVFNNNTGLILLLLYGNKIKNLTSNAFSQLMKLRWLDLGNNQIKELPPGVFNNNTELIKLWLYGNKIKHLTSNAFFQLIKLKWLQLNDNDLTELQEGLFDGLRALTHLFLSKNQIGELPSTIFVKLTKLEALKMEKNKLKELHSKQFRGLAKLSELYLSGNKLRYLPQGIFKGLKQLLILFLHYNYMREIPYGFFEELKDILRVSLDTNLMCCHMHKEDADCAFIDNDDFANCENMFKNPIPRKSIWAIGSLSLAGSVFVITWRSVFKDTNTVQSIMLLHLAVSDGLMGAYLITLGVKDLLWREEYYLHDFKWQSGLACQIIGATSLLSSEVSLMLMALISADRLKNIVFLFRGGALSRKMTQILCAIIWLVGFLLAFFPMFGLRYFEDLTTYHNYYGKNVVCLPLQPSRHKTEGWEYSVSVFVGLNFFLFIFITVAYLAIFISRVRVKNQSANANARRETGLAKRVSFIIFTDCLCWMPIIVFGMKSVLEKDYKQPGDLAVWIAVFALPINSVINPILYTLATPKAQEYLGSKMAMLRSFIRSTFYCSEDQEGRQQDPQEIDDNGQQEVRFLSLFSHINKKGRRWKCRFLYCHTQIKISKKLKCWKCSKYLPKNKKKVTKEKKTLLKNMIWNMIQRCNHWSIKG